MVISEPGKSTTVCHIACRGYLSDTSFLTPKVGKVIYSEYHGPPTRLLAGSGLSRPKRKALKQRKGLILFS